MIVKVRKNSIIKFILQKLSIATTVLIIIKNTFSYFNIQLAPTNNCYTYGLDITAYNLFTLYIYIYISSFIVNPMTHRIREQTNNQTIRRRKHNIIALTITRIID